MINEKSVCFECRQEYFGKTPPCDSCNMKVDEFIDKNRPIIDELLGPNQDAYICIALKGKLAGHMPKNKAMELFAEILHLPYNEQNKILRNRLEEIKCIEKKI